MGGTSWSDAHYHDKEAHRAATSTPAFAYSAKIEAGEADAVVHDTLDPLRKAGKTSVLAGQNIREARDSDAHPLSNAVAVMFDVTGSMRDVPRILQKNLVSLMRLLLQESYLTDPAILISGIGDATCDRVPLQIGQFESGIEIENDLTNLFLEGGGGSYIEESYELALYFLARKTAIDCFEKRGKKGHAFLIGDEKARDVDRKAVERLFGDTLQDNISLADIVKEAQEKWDIFFIVPNMTAHYNDPEILSFWKRTLGDQNVIKLDNPEDISSMIATLIGKSEGVDEEKLDKAMESVGAELATRDSIKSAISKVKSRSDRGELSVAGTGLSPA